jgi:hypothetical protein
VVVFVGALSLSLDSLLEDDSTDALEEPTVEFDVGLVPAHVEFDVGLLPALVSLVKLLIELLGDNASFFQPFFHFFNRAVNLVHT